MRHYKRWWRHGDPKFITRREPGHDRYAAVMEIGYDVVGECHAWRGGLTDLGYACIGEHKAYRIVYENFHGPVTKGMVVDHNCHNIAVSEGKCSGGECIHRKCINPDHLRMVTQAENLLASELAAGRKACINGHPFSEENTYLYKGEYRRCRTCHRRDSRESAARGRRRSKG